MRQPSDPEKTNKQTNQQIRRKSCQTQISLGLTKWWCAPAYATAPFLLSNNLIPVKVLSALDRLPQAALQHMHDATHRLVFWWAKVKDRHSASLCPGNLVNFSRPLDNMCNGSLKIILRIWIHAIKFRRALHLDVYVIWPSIMREVGGVSRILRQLGALSKIHMVQILVLSLNNSHNFVAHSIRYYEHNLIWIGKSAGVLHFRRPSSHFKRHDVLFLGVCVSRSLNTYPRSRCEENRDIPTLDTSEFCMHGGLVSFHIHHSML